MEFYPLSAAYAILPNQDSGLAVYKDIDKVAAWKKRGLQYHDLCDPCWIMVMAAHLYSRTHQNACSNG